MSQTIGQVINQLQCIGELDVVNINMDSNETTYHHVSHKYREEIIIPYIGLENNISFMINKGERYIIFADGIKAKVVESSEKHICELEEDITRIYKCDVWTFIKQWYKAYPVMQSMIFIVVKVKKEG